jgi:PilZ domain
VAEYKMGAERRQWGRLPLAIPLFVRSRDQNGKEFVEFATALNVSASGALVAVHHALRVSAQVLLEIPSAPVAVVPAIPKSFRKLRAKIVRVSYGDRYYLLGLKFSRPLLSSKMKPRAVAQEKLTPERE